MSGRAARASKQRKIREAAELRRKVWDALMRGMTEAFSKITMAPLFRMMQDNPELACLQKQWAGRAVTFDIVQRNDDEAQ